VWIIGLLRVFINAIIIMESLHTVCATHHVDMPHARHVALAAARLFSDTQSAHCLPARAAALLEAGVLLHNVGLHEDEEHHHEIGRDIVMRSALEGFNQTEQAMIACLVFFHRREIDPAVEPLYNKLDDDARRQVLVLSGLLRIADGLDQSLTQSTVIDKVEIRDTLDVRVSGPHSHADAARAMEKADVWTGLFGMARVHGRVTQPGIHADMTLAEAGRRIMRYHFDQLRGGWRFDTGLDTIPAKRTKSLRIVVRRLRADLGQFRECYKKKALKPVERGLKALAALSGPVREFDMLIDSLQVYRDGCDEDAHAAVQPLLDVWKKQRLAARLALVEHLRSPEYDQWLDACHAFLDAPPGAPDRRARIGEPSLVRHALDILLWQHLSQVRAYDVMPDKPDLEDLHALRGAIKRTRFFVDACREVLPAGADDLVARCVAAQDVYGRINDAHVSAMSARAYVAEQRGTRKIALKGLVAFAEAQQHVIEGSLAGWRAPQQAVAAGLMLPSVQ
jgi:CHAD domain-containing protein